MSTQILSNYYVGKNQPYPTINQAINVLVAAFNSGDYILPSSSFDGGNINIIIVGGGQFPGFTIPDSTTTILKDLGRYLVIKRQESVANGELETNSLPVLSPNAPGSHDLSIQERATGINLGSNNPNVKLIGLRIQGFSIGISAGTNCHNLYINRCFVTNCYNAQIYIHDCDSVYITNNVIIGGEYGLVTQQIRNLRVYHNTVFLDGLTALGGATKAGMILQGDRLLLSVTTSTVYCLGNLVYTIGCPAIVFYKEDLLASRLVSDYNDIYSSSICVQLRQDNGTLPSDANQAIQASYYNINAWRQAGPLGNTTIPIDFNSISAHPIFIQNISLSTSQTSSIINLNLLQSSPVIDRVPSWYYSVDSFYIPSDFDEELISKDSLLHTREQPYCAIGANDELSLNGFFGQDIFTNPLSLTPDRNCDIDPLNVISAQQIDMQYPAIKAGYFWSHERPYYLYGAKGAVKLGALAQTTFNIPGRLDVKKPIVIKINDTEISKEDYDVIGNSVIVYHRSNGIVSENDEVQISGQIIFWYQTGFSTENAYYVYKISDGVTKFILPHDFQPGAPIVITDDRVSFTNPIDAVRQDFFVKFDSERNETQLKFGLRDNLFQNSDFTYSDGNVPEDWISAIQDPDAPTVRMLWNQYSYFGDYAVGLNLAPIPGHITSNHIHVNVNDPLSITWHAKLPTEVTGLSGASYDTATGQWFITQFDNYDEELITKFSGSFEITNDTYRRFYIPIGATSDTVNTNLTGIASAPLVYLATTPIVLDDTVTKIEFTLSGLNYSGLMQSGSFMIIDALQAERSIEPSYYHPKPDYNAMTVEYETSPSGVFIDKRLNITPIFNENPNGFLYITDMPATIWNGPSDPEVTTLHEYRWPHGRMNLLPWARLFGKDKLHQRVVESDSLSEPLDIINPYVFPKIATEAIITPSTVIINQNSETPESVHLQVIDEIGNPFGLRNFVAHIYDTNGNFPGWLSMQYMGAKQQLGSTIFGSLNNNGAFNFFYHPMESIYTRYVGPTPVYQSGLSGYDNTISHIKTAYRISTENNGNVTIKGQNGDFHNIVGLTGVSGQFYPETDKSRSFITLQYPPAFGTVKLHIDDIKFSESANAPESEEFYVNYPFGQIELPIGIDTTLPVSIEYMPKYAYADPINKDNIIIHHDKVFGSYSGPIEVDYDVEINLEVRIQNPLDREFIATFPIVVQNSELSKVNPNPMSIEF